MNIAHRLLPALSTLGFAALVSAGPAPVAFDWFQYEGQDAIFAEAPPEGHFQNPVLAGFYTDPRACRVGDDFYLVNSSFGFFPGVPIFHSTDLVHWEQLGHVLDRPSQLDADGLTASRNIFAPTIRHHDGVFYMITTDVDGIGNFYVTATDPAGPWSDPKTLPWINGIDSSFFFDEDGRVYITHNGPPPDNKSLYEGHRAVWLWEIDLATNEPIGEGKIIINGGVDLAEEPVWIEAPHIFRKDGWYYLTCAEGGTSVNHSQVIFRTREIDGEWIPWDQNPILTQRDLPADRAHPIEAAGHADFLKLPNGEWWAIFLAIRPYEDGYYNTGRETYLLPVEWTEDGWPVILERGKEIPWTLPAPALPTASENLPPTTGNFTWKDDFVNPILGYEWMFLRTPQGNWANVDTEHGHLLIQPQGHRLSDLKNPSFLARRQQHSSYEAATRLRIPDTGVSAGIGTFIREDHSYYFGVRQEAGTLVAFLEKAEGGEAEVVARVELELPEDAEWITLGMTAETAELDFYVELPDGERRIVAENEDATILTTTKAWGFIGAMFGPYARLEL